MVDLFTLNYSFYTFWAMQNCQKLIVHCGKSSTFLILCVWEGNTCKYREIRNIGENLYEISKPIETFSLLFLKIVTKGKSKSVWTSNLTILFTLCPISLSYWLRINIWLLNSLSILKIKYLLKSYLVSLNFYFPDTIECGIPVLFPP